MRSELQEGTFDHDGFRTAGKWETERPQGDPGRRTACRNAGSDAGFGSVWAESSAGDFRRLAGQTSVAWRGGDVRFGCAAAFFHRFLGCSDLLRSEPQMAVL